MTLGISMMPKLSVEVLVLLTLQKQNLELILDRDLKKCGLMMLHALERNSICKIVVTVDGVKRTAVMMRMLVLYALVKFILIVTCLSGLKNPEFETKSCITFLSFRMQYGNMA